MPTVYDAAVYVRREGRLIRLGTADSVTFSFKPRPVCIIDTDRIDQLDKQPFVRATVAIPGQPDKLNAVIDACGKFHIVGGASYVNLWAYNDKHPSHTVHIIDV